MLPPRLRRRRFSVTSMITIVPPMTSTASPARPQSKACVPPAVNGNGCVVGGVLTTSPMSPPPYGAVVLGDVSAACVVVVGATVVVVLGNVVVVGASVVVVGASVVV